MRKFRSLFLLVALLSAPVFVFTYGWAMRLLFHEVSMWLWPPIVLAHGMTFVGLALLAEPPQ